LNEGHQLETSISPGIRGLVASHVVAIGREVRRIVLHLGHIWAIDPKVRPIDLKVRAIDPKVRAIDPKVWPIDPKVWPIKPKVGGTNVDLGPIDIRPRFEANIGAKIAIRT
jgi:hypothetical protein